MHIVLTVSLAMILVFAVIAWAVLVLIRAHLRRQRRMRCELQELRRAVRRQPE